LSVFVIIPTYNERENLPRILSTVAERLPEAHILVVDDNSPDGTGDLAESLMQSFGGRLHILHRQKKEGLGPAYIAGFKEAMSLGAQKLIEMDADFSHPPEALPEMVRLSDTCDLVIGSRYVPGGSTPGWPLRRRLLSRFANFYARTILRLSVKDVTAGFRCYNRKVLEALHLDAVESKGYGFQVELTFRAEQKGFRIGETPIAFKDREKGKSKMGLSIAWEAAVKVLKMRWAAKCL